MKRLALIALLGASTVWTQDPASWTPELAMQMNSVGGVALSATGTLAAYEQTRAVMEAEKSEMLTHIFLASVDGSRRTQLTRGEKSATSPAFSPDARLLYFLSERSGKQNLYRIAVDGGEAEMLTDWKGSLGAYAVSPDGRWLAFSAAEEDKEEEKAKKEKRDLRVVDANPKNQSLWVIPAEAGQDGKRTPRQLAGGDFHVARFAWSPDGRHIALERWPMPGADYWTRGDIWEVALENGALKPLAATGAAESNPRYSPDGRWVGFELSGDPPRWPGQTRLAVLDRSNGQVRPLPLSQDERPNLIGWTADSRRVLFSEVRRTRGAIFAMPLEGAPAVFYEPAKGTTMAGALNTTGTHLGFVEEAPQDPPEVFVMSLSGGRPQRVSAANTSLPRPPLGETRVVRWKSKDGLEIEGLLSLPAGYREGDKVPLILNIHGGPAGVFMENFLGRPAIYPLAAFTAKGWAVLRPNPRGSSGYGREFRFANIKDWGGMDYHDLMTGVDHVIAAGIADPAKLTVMGWSYGGFMTSWIITQTDRFKAAVVGAAVTNLWSFAGTADIPGFLPDYFQGEPWDNFESYRQHSPMSHVGRARTPALILHGEADIRVPVSQGYELYNALKRRGVKTQMVVYPRMPHGPREPKFILDLMQRHVQWIEEHIR